MISCEYGYAIVNTLEKMGIKEEFNKLFLEELSKLLPEDLLPSSGF